MFDFLKKKQKGEVLGSPIEGEVVSVTEVNDPTFGEEILGKGVAIKPTNGKVYAPVDGKVTMMFETKHAFSMLSAQGAEILVHIGLDTVTLKGKHFTAHVGNDAEVKKGDLLLEFDVEALKAEGFDVISPMVITNSDDFKEIIRETNKDVKPGDQVMELVK
ncbi:MAG TPA: PTS glucose transporter subunit IIA [Candidatus Dorea intestinavium]|nr:PTS glucose transporter subunit IIA [Candidatus Dorea intestinavium]